MESSNETTAFVSADDSHWVQFIESKDLAEFASSWLALLCNSIDGIIGAMVLMGKANEGPYSPVAIWPEQTSDLQYLVPSAEQALAGRKGVLTDASLVEATGQVSRQIAYPLEVSGVLHGVTVLDLADRPVSQIQAVMRQLLWGGAWLENRIRRAMENEGRQTIERLATLTELTVQSAQYEHFGQGAMVLVNELAARLPCDRVTLGVVKRNTLQLIAVSNTSNFQERSNLAQATRSAMEEAVDQQSLILSPSQASEGDVLISRMHDDFCKRYELASVCTVPLPGKSIPFGALFCERTTHPFDGETLELLKGVGYLLGPLLEAQWQQEHWIKTRMLGAPLRLLRRYAGPDGFVLKVVSGAVLLLVLLLALIRTDYRIDAKTVIEGSVQRTLAAPFDGFIASAESRPGDIVQLGQVLCTLDDRDLFLERKKWFTVSDQYTQKYRQSIAKHERAEARITDAQLKQAEAEGALLDEKLTRAKITAPFNGFIISGDLHQRQGSPVQQGEELFKIAPLDQYRVILQVDERDFAQVRIGQPGQVVLSSLPNDTFAFAVKRVTPVSLAEEGRNYFRVEAELDKASDLLRPGMEGVGKVVAGRRSLLWIWTHRVTEWMVLKLWQWAP